MKSREFIASRFKRHISRLRHKRGHGVHSPYIYNIVREVFMSHVAHTPQTSLYEQLISLGVKRRCGVEIENLRHHCGYSTFGVDTLEPFDMVICSQSLSDQATLEIIKNSAINGTTIVILSPYKSLLRGKMCDCIISHHHSTTVNRRGYLIIFNNHLPKQHFIL